MEKLEVRWAWFKNENATSLLLSVLSKQKWFPALLLLIYIFQEYFFK